VLSFSEYAKISEMCDNMEKELFLGEIIICPDYVASSAKVQGVSFEFELAYIFSHGILHLLDFSHGEEMFSLQEEIAKKIVK
jgi:probable rRNA maturation factor